MHLPVLISLLPMVLRLVTAIPTHNLVLPKLPSTTYNLTMGSSDLIKVWADEARRRPIRQKMINQRAIDILEALFEGKDTPERSATKLTATYNPALQEGFKLSPVFELWGMICEATQVLGGDWEIDKNLIELLNALARQPDVTDESGKAIGPGGGYDGVYWKDLPALPIMFREYAIGTSMQSVFCADSLERCLQREDIEPGEPEMPASGDWTDAQKKRLLDVVTFGALYLHYGEVDIGMSFHAEVSMMYGIEGPYQTPEQQRGALTDVPPAATWILIAGSDIYKLCKTGKTERGRGFDLGRWALWKSKFDEISENQGLTEDVRDIARRAAMAMSGIED